MADHPKDKGAHNPRIQCVVCGKWKRLHTRSEQPPHGLHQTFFGGCEYNAGNDHLAKKGDDNDVCELCCHVECKRLSMSSHNREESQ